MVKTKERENELEELRKLMSHQWGRNVVRRLLAFSGVKNQCYNGRTEDTIFNDGKRKVGLYLESEVLEAAPGSYLKMIEEAISDE